VQVATQSAKSVGAESTNLNEMVHSLVSLLENQAQRIADQAGEIHQLRAEADILRWRCGAADKTAQQQPSPVNKNEAPTTAPLAVKESTDRLSSATEFLAELKSRYQKLAEEEEALQKELNMVSVIEEPSYKK
jgi:chromosome segregation ATPase